MKNLILLAATILSTTAFADDAKVVCDVTLQTLNAGMVRTSLEIFSDDKYAVQQSENLKVYIKLNTEEVLYVDLMDSNTKSTVFTHRYIHSLNSQNDNLNVGLSSPESNGIVVCRAK